MSRSGGEIMMAVTCDAMRKRNANHPKIGQRLVRGATMVPANGGALVVMSYLDHCLEREKCRGEKNHVEHNEQPSPGPGVTHHVTAKQRLRCLHRRKKHRYEHGEEEERKQHLASSAAAGHRRVERAQRDEPDRPEKNDSEERRPFTRNDDLEQDDAG